MSAQGDLCSSLDQAIDVLPQLALVDFDQLVVTARWRFRA